MAKQARDLAVTALVQWEREHAYSNIILDQLLKEEALSSADGALTTRLIYGVIERCLTLDWLLEKCSKQPLKKCHPLVRAILRVGAYQLVFMNKIPASAAVNEAVGQTKRMKQPYAVGYVNGVLRGLERQKTELMSTLPQDMTGDSIRYSVPLPLLRLWDSAYGADMRKQLANSVNTVPPSTVRVNTLKTTPAAFCAALKQAGIGYHPVDGLAEAFDVENVAALSKAVPSAQYYFQDAASQWACAALSPQPGETVADVCAAPGGKSLTAAQWMQNTGKLVSCDIYTAKVKTLRDRARQYGVTILNAYEQDAAGSCPESWIGHFDRVLCDVLCSGLGALRRKPEIRYKELESFAGLPALQYAILCRSAALVKPGGVLQYSTCTLNPAENEQVVGRFLAEHPDFKPRPLPIETVFAKAELPVSHMVTLLPPIHGTDGFFIASFQKEG